VVEQLPAEVQYRAVDGKLTRCAPLQVKLLVLDEQVSNWEWVDALHQHVLLSFGGRQLSQLDRHVFAVCVMTAALAVGFEHYPSRLGQRNQLLVLALILKFPHASQ